MTSDQPVTAVPADPSGNGSGPATVSLDQTFCADNLFALRNAVAAHGGSLGLSSTRVAGSATWVSPRSCMDPLGWPTAGRSSIRY